MGWLTLTDVRRHFDPHDFFALAHYNDKPDEQNTYPPLRSAYCYVVRLVFPLVRTIIRIRSFSDMNLRDTRRMRERGSSPLRDPTQAPPVPAETTSALASVVVEAEAAEAVVVEDPKPERRNVQVKGTTKTRSRAK